MMTLRKLLSLLDARQRRGGLAVLIAMIIGMIFEMFGIGLVLPVITLMTSPDAIHNFAGGTAVLSLLGNPTQQQLVVWGVIALAVLIAVKNTYIVGLSWFQSKFVFTLHASLSQRLFSAYLRKPYVFHLQNNSAELIRNVVNEVNLFTNAAQALMTLSTELLISFGVAALLMYVEPFGTVVVVLLLGFAVISFYIAIRKRLSHWGQARQRYDGKRIQLVQEGLGSIKEIKLLGREEDFLKQYSQYNVLNAKVLQHQNFLQQIPRLWLETLAIVGLAAIVLVMMGQGKAPEAFLPTVGLFGAAAFRLMPSLNRCMTAMQSARFAVAAINVLHGELSQKVEPPSRPGARQPLPITSRIELKDVSFLYPETEKAALDSVSLSIPIGASVGFIGKSGAGKSTLVDLILGLNTPKAGQILVDGTDIFRDRRAWQDQIGYVPQTIALIDDTLRRNIALGLSDSDIDDSHIWSALELAQLDTFVRGLPEGLNTFLGERGVRLSGGQRQRIGIARALYPDPPVLVLDEATSSLDKDTERGVMQAIKAMQGKKTIIIITHRLSTIEHCEVIFRLDKGKLVEEAHRPSPSMETSEQIDGRLS